MPGTIHRHVCSQWLQGCISMQEPRVDFQEVTSRRIKLLVHCFSMSMNGGSHSRDPSWNLQDVSALLPLGGIYGDFRGSIQRNIQFLQALLHLRLFRKNPNQIVQIAWGYQEPYASESVIPI